MIGIICALDVELALINEKMENREEKEIYGLTFTKGTIYNNEVVSCVCGMGKVNAALCAQSMILLYNTDIIINTGIAGGVSEKLSVCDIAVADSLCEHDLDLTPIGYPLGYIGGDNMTVIPADKEISEKLASLAKKIDGINVITGRIATGDQFISSNEKKEFLRNTFDAVACEMEGGAIAHVCYMNKVKVAVVRAISDGASDEAYIDVDKFMDIAAKNSASLILDYLKSLN